MNNDIKLGVIYYKCSECNSDISICDNCYKVFNKEQVIACDIGIKHYCEHCNDKMRIKNTIYKFSISPVNFIIKCLQCDFVIIDCSYCGYIFEKNDNVYCSNTDKHICEKCYKELKILKIPILKSLKNGDINGQ